MQRESAALAPAGGWPVRFSYDAVRIPLWLAWAGLRDEPALRNARRFWAAQAALPAWVDLATDVPSPYPAPPGIAAIAQLALADGRAAPLLPAPRDILSAKDYYTIALGLLAVAAGEDRRAIRG